MRFVVPAVLALILTPVSACSASYDSDNDGKSGVTATGTGDQRRWAIRDFDAIGLGAVGDVQVRVGPDWSVSATGPSSALDKLRVVRDGRGLKLERRRGISWGRGDKVRFVVTMPAIREASIGGSGSIVIDHVRGKSFEGNIGGSGDLNIQDMRVAKTSFAIGGSGNVMAAGTTKALDVSIGGSGKLRLQPLVAQGADITIAGSGDIRGTVHGDAQVTIVGAGDVTLGGGATCKVTKMGSGTVRCS